MKPDLFNSDYADTCTHVDNVRVPSIHIQIKSGTMVKYIDRGHLLA